MEKKIKNEWSVDDSAEHDGQTYEKERKGSGAGLGH